MPQHPPQPHRTETPRSLQAYRIEPYRSRFERRVRFEQAALQTLNRSTRDSARQQRRTCPSFSIKFPELCNRLLSHFAPVTHRAHQAPIDVRFTILVSRRMSQVHTPYSRHAPRLAQPTWSALHALSWKIYPPRRASQLHYRVKPHRGRRPTPTSKSRYPTTTVEVGLDFDAQLCSMSRDSRCWNRRLLGKSPRKCLPNGNPNGQLY